MGSAGDLAGAADTVARLEIALAEAAAGMRDFLQNDGAQP